MTMMNSPRRRTSDEVAANAYAELRRRLTAKPGPLEVSAAYEAHRHAMFIAPNREGLAGPDAIYHLPKAAAGLWSAAQILGGVGISGFGINSRLPAKRRLRIALDTTLMAHGWRYKRGVQGLADALDASGYNDEVRQYQRERDRFAIEFERRAVAADIVIDDGENGAAVAKLLRIFINEMHTLARWLDSPGVFLGAGTAQGVAHYCGMAEAELG